MTIRHIYLLICATITVLLLRSVTTYGQVLPYPSATNNLNRLESNIKDKTALAQTRRELEIIYRDAANAGNNILQARSLYNLIRVRDELTEDSLYFRNSEEIDTLLRSARTTAKLKAILYVMQAKRVSGFDQRSRKFNFAAYRLKNLMNNYAGLTSSERLEMSRKLLDSALIHSSVDRNEATQLLWLSVNPDIFLFQPRFEDIVLSEKVNQASAISWSDADYRTLFSNMLSLPEGVFAGKLDSLATTSKKGGKVGVLTAYHNWMNFNKANVEVKLFIESLARKSIYMSVQGDSVADKAYAQYLLNNTRSRYDLVRAHSVYQLCLQWNMEGNRYKGFGNTYDYFSNETFNPRYQYLPAKALQLYEQHKQLFENYPTFKSVLDIMAAQIKAKALRVEMSTTNLPGDAIPLKVTYKNTDTLFYRIIKINAKEAPGKKRAAPTADLLLRPVVASGIFALPLPADHNVHATHLKFDGLQAGRYRLLFSHAPITIANDTLNNICFNVTGIVAINTDERVFVLSRKTGQPLTGARIAAFNGKKSVKKGIPSTLPASGFLVVDEDVADSLSISFKGDTIGYDVSIHENELTDDIYDEDNYDDLTEFYDDKLRAEIFTDRSIYRPGQTVHYKMILLTKHPKTGETILFNRQNLGGGLFKSRLRKWLRDDNDEIELRDIFGKKIDSARFKINAFGSFAGSFTLPKSAATGDWNIRSYFDTDHPNYGSFRVEEYKRPSIELSMEKQSKMLLPGQPFTIKLKLRSFNGSDLNNVPIKYTVTRSGDIIQDIKAINNTRHYAEDKLFDTSGYTNAKGELLIPVYDTVLVRANLPDSLLWTYNYNIDAKAVDFTGESTKLDDKISISSRPVSIKVNISGMVDKQALPALNIRAYNIFEGDMERKIRVKIYRTGKAQQFFYTVNQKDVDQWYYPERDWFSWFPKDTPDELNLLRTLVVDTVVNTASSEKLILNKEKFGPGFYEMEATTADNGHTLGLIKQNFTVFDSQKGEWVGDEVSHFPFNTAAIGGTVSWYTSGRSDNFTIYHAVYVNNKNKVITQYHTLKEPPGIRQWKYTIPIDATGQVLITRVTVKNNEIYTSDRRVYVIAANKFNPDIIVERYRKVMVPGARETFSVSVKTKNENVVAELMTTLYDASLDKLEPHRWELPQTDKRETYLNADWDQSITSTGIAEYLSAEMNPVNLFKLSAAERENNVFGSLLGRVAGLDVVGARGLEEVVVVGYGTMKRSLLTGSIFTISIRGNSLIDYKQPLIVLDGAVITEDKLKSIDPAAITQALVLKGADASSIYGMQAAEGVFVISTKGPIVFPEPPAPEVKIRKNFNETAFFFPQVHADQDGFYTFSFTMPETATEWNWKMLAHTRDARFAYLEKKLQTQLNLMVQPNIPRLLYQGDKIKLQSRISNQDTLGVKGKSTLKIEDAVTGEDITRLLSTSTETAFDLNKKSSGSVAFTLNIPAGQTHPLKIVITATGGGAADAEEHIIPVLSSKVFIRQSMPVHFEDKATLTLSKPKLPADAISYGLGISINQQPQASLIYALPWLAGYSFDCAEQTFNKLRAQATALKLMQKDTSVQSAFKRAKAFMEKENVKTDALPGEMAEQAMPWLTLTNNTAAQQKQLFRLLDTSVTKTTIEKHLQRLYALQKPDGGLSWFDGGESNAYISGYVLAGFGQLKEMGWRAGNTVSNLQKTFIDKLVEYTQNKMSTDSSAILDKPNLLYALSYWLKDYSLSTEQAIAANNAIEKELNKVSDKNLQQQALLIINALKHLPAGNALRLKADAQLENIRQMAIQDDLNGIRWKAIADAESMNSSAEETMALLAEAFELSGKYKDVQAGIVKWLLTAKQQEHWQTTKATAAAINMLQKEKGGAIDSARAFSADIAGKQLAVSDGLIDGKPADFLSAKELPASISLKQSSTNATGAVTWYYFAKPDGLDTLSRTVKIKKEFFIYDASRSRPMPVQEGTILKAGESLQVKLTVEAAATLQYVHINDPRAALFEPGENSSGYRYSKGTGYYQSIRDTGLELFTEAIPRGITEFTYDVLVAHSGQFRSGPATLQCMYQPALTAYSNTHSFETE